MENPSSSVTRGQLRQFRKEQGWSMARLGQELANGLPRGYSRSYIKNLESGTMPVSRFVAERFKLLRSHVRGEQVAHKEILLRGRFPRRLVISGKPKRCDVCGWPFIGSTPSQKRCGPVCAKIARSASGKSRKRCRREQAHRARRKSTGRHLHLPQVQV